MMAPNLGVAAHGGPALTGYPVGDKISASKRKGLWVGGMVPLGYDTNKRRITVNEAEGGPGAHYLPQFSQAWQPQPADGRLAQTGHVRTLKTGATVGGIPFTRGPLAHLLRNRFYIGEVPFKGEVFQGEQPRILDRELFDAGPN
jgi:site-specific DNA recombinase